MIQTLTLADGIKLHCFYDNRFKQGCLSFQMVRPMCDEEASLNALLPAVLLRGTQVHPDLRSLTLHLDNLYGASVDSMIMRVGDHHTTGLHCTLMDDRFALPGDTVLKPVLDFLEELLLAPALENGVFRTDYVESEKKNLISALESEINNKRAYALRQMIRTMCKDDSLRIGRLGDKDRVAAITPQSLYDHYRKILRESPIEMFYVGSASAQQMAQLLMPLISRLDRDHKPCRLQTVFSGAACGHHVERMDVAQAQLCMGYVTPIVTESPEFAAMQMMNTIFGSGMTSKLFMNVREKLSLCYSIGSAYYTSKGIILLSAGIDAAKEQEVTDEIKVQLQAMCDGDITDEEMASAREALLSGLRCVHDSPNAISNYYFGAKLSDLHMTPAEYQARIAAVTKADVAAVARTLKLHTTYILKGDDHEEI